MSVAVDTACSSTLVALDLAILRLRAGLEAVICSGSQLNLIVEPWRRAEETAVSSVNSAGGFLQTRLRNRSSHSATEGSCPQVGVAEPLTLLQMALRMQVFQAWKQNARRIIKYLGRVIKPKSQAQEIDEAASGSSSPSEM